MQLIITNRRDDRLSSSQPTKRRKTDGKGEEDGEEVSTTLTRRLTDNATAIGTMVKKFDPLLLEYARDLNYGYEPKLEPADISSCNFLSSWEGFGYIGLK